MNSSFFFVGEKKIFGAWFALGLGRRPELLRCVDWFVLGSWGSWLPVPLGIVALGDNCPLASFA